MLLAKATTSRSASRECHSAAMKSQRAITTAVVIMVMTIGREDIDLNTRRVGAVSIDPILPASQVSHANRHFHCIQDPLSAILEEVEIHGAHMGRMPEQQAACVPRT